jgi:nicotinamidase-related amidase
MSRRNDMKPALLVIDVQRAWLSMSEGLKCTLERRLGTINGAIGLFRERGMPLIVVYHSEPKEGVVPDSEGFEFHPGVKIEVTDLMLVKSYPNAFNKTELQEILAMDGCDTVILAGLSAMGCIMATYVGAMDRDIHPYLLREGVAADSEEHVRLAQEIFDSLSLDALDQVIPHKS